MSAKRAKDRPLLSRQEIAVRRRQLNSKKMATPAAPRRAIAGVVLLALSVLALFSVATFDAQDRVGPGFRNAIGPVGHAIAEALRGLFGLCALVLPLVGFYSAALLFIGQREKRRWPQVVAFALLLVAFAVLAQLVFHENPSWSHAPGGLIGRQVGGVLTALFSTVGTVVLVSAIAAVAFIVGTQFAFLRFCSWVWVGLQHFASRAKALSLRFLEAQQARLEARRAAAEQAKLEEAAFLASLEAEEAELAEIETAAEQAEFFAAEAERLEKGKENAKLADLAEKDRLKADREKSLVEREAARLAKEAIKTARLHEKAQRSTAAAALAPTLLDEMKAHAPMHHVSPPGFGQDPAWALSLSAPIEHSAFANQALAAKRLPTIVEPQAAPRSAIDTLPPVTHAQTQAASEATTLPPLTLLDSAVAGATALARMPVIIEPKAPPKPTAPLKKKTDFEFSGDRTSFVVPPVDLLEAKVREHTNVDKSVYLATAEKLVAKLRDFGIEGEVVEIRPGPVVTMYEFKPAAGVKISRIASLSDDLAMAMEAMRVRIVAPIPGKGVVGIEVPNKQRETVFLKEIAEQDAFQKSQSRLTMCLGKDIEGMPYIFDLAKAPHLLMAGTTGSGKSVAVNSMIMSILLKSTPEEVRFIMVDPKMLELSVYEGIPHLLLPVVTDPRKAAIALQWAVDEMTRRYKLLSEAGVRNISGYNLHVEQQMAQRKASKMTVNATPTVIKPPLAVMQPDEAAPFEAQVAAQVETPPAEPPKKKRRMLIVDVADGQALAPSTEVTEAGSLGQEVGVPAPHQGVEDPREEVVGVEPMAQSALTDAIANRIEEAPVTPEEVAALAEAAAERAAAAADEAKEDLTKLPYIVVIIDELADLMMVASKEVETSIARLAQMARAAGIHLMVATQRPSTDVVTGVIKANFPTRISFMLRSKPDSMTIIGTIGAEALLGMGDMLIMPPTSAHLQRVHGCFVSETEIKKVVDQLKAQGKPVFDESILKPRDDEGDTSGEDDELSDELYDQAVAIVSEMRTVSISMLQRKMRIGYNRAARMIERMERDGMVGSADGAKPREVLIRQLGQMPGVDAM